MITSTRRPTFQECLEWARTLPGEFAPLRTAMREEEDLYFQKFKIEAPFGKMGVKTGSAPSDVDAAIDLLTPKTVDVKWRPLRQKPKYRKKAQKQERACKGLIHHFRRPRDVIRQFVSDMCLHRIGVMRLMWDQDMWPEIPADYLPEPLPKKGENESEEVFNKRLLQVKNKKRDELEAWEVTKRRRNPLLLEQRNAMDVSWRELNGSLMVVVEEKLTTVLDVKATLEYETVDVITRGMSLTDEIILYDVWFGGYRCLILRDQPVFDIDFGTEFRGVAPHEYPTLPYLIAGFRELPFDEPAKKYRGLLTNAAQLYPAESQVYTMYMWMLGWNAWRTWVGHFKDKDKNPQIVPGVFVDIDKRVGEYLEMLTGQPVPPELMQIAQQFGAMISRNGLQAGPAAGENSRSAAQLWAQQSVKQLKIEAAMQAAQLVVEQMLSNGMELIDCRLTPEDRMIIPVPGNKPSTGEDDAEIELKKSDIDGDWDGATVSFGSRLDPALLEQWAKISNLVENKWLPKYQGYELAGLPYTPEELIDQLYVETADELPFMTWAAALERVKQHYGEGSVQYNLMLQHMTPGAGGAMSGPQADNPMDGAGLTPAASAMAPNGGAGGGGPSATDALGAQMAGSMKGGGGGGGAFRGGARASQKPPNIPG